MLRLLQEVPSLSTILEQKSALFLRSSPLSFPPASFGAIERLSVRGDVSYSSCTGLRVCGAQTSCERL